MYHITRSYCLPERLWMAQADINQGRVNIQNETPSEKFLISEIIIVEEVYHTFPHISL
jgi:hypothetical protein